MAKSNYIQNMVNQYGETWIVTVRPEDIQRSSKRIFKDMVYGNIDYEKYGKYFLDSKFLDNLIIACKNELETNTIYFNAVSFYKGYYPNIPNIGVHLTHLNTLCFIYSNILSKLNTVKQTNNIGYLADTSAILYSHRNHLN